MKKIILSIASLFFCFSGVAQSESSTQEPIKIIINNWSSQRIVARIAGSLFQRQGFAIKYMRLPTAGAVVHVEI